MSIWSLALSRPHKHKCEECGIVWKHIPDDIKDNSAAHRCPAGCESWSYGWYHGKEKACCVFTGFEDVSGLVSRARQNV